MKRREPLFTWDEISSLPGIFEPGSDADNALVERQKDKKRRRSLVPFVARSGPLAEYQIIDADLTRISTWHVPHEWLEHEDLCWMFDIERIMEIDRRVRYCRCFLQAQELPWDRGSIRVSENEMLWSYESDIPPDRISELPKQVDPLDWLLVAGDSEPEWYAAKVLVHYRRARSLCESTGSARLSENLLLRMAGEWMLFGEYWAETKLVINHAHDAVRGRKLLVAEQVGHEAVHGTEEEKMARWTAQRSDFEKLRANGVKKMAAYSRVAEKYGVSEKTVRRAVKKPPR